jgi:hypothetical protein
MENPMKKYLVFITGMLLIQFTVALYSWQPTTVKKKATFTICASTASSAEASARNQFAEATLTYADCTCGESRYGSVSCKGGTGSQFTCKCVER